MRRHTIALATTLTTLLAVPAIAQPAWPAKEVRLISPFAAGSAGSELVARQVAEKFRTVWGQPVIVENVPGASGTIGVAKLAKSAPDGYTLVMSGDAAIVVATSIYKSVAYDPIMDLMPIIQVSRTPNILVVNKNTGPKSLKELVETAKAKVDGVSFNSVGYGTSQHMAIEQLQRMAGIKVLHAPKNGPTAPEILGGQVTASFMNITQALPLVQAGSLRALGISGASRSPSAPDIPTVAEQGYPGFDAVAWNGLFAPAGTPDNIIRKIQADTAKVLADPEFRVKLTQMGAQIVENSTPESFAALIKSEIPRIAELIRASGIKLD
jgi:tripartite-type tricarboxylate transporter receptor subunit TctC